MVRFEDRLGALSVVGAGINASFENVRRGSAALEAAGIETADLSTSSFRITWMVDRTKLDDAVRLLHRTFIEQHGPAVP
jgi:aspartate kinase